MSRLNLFEKGKSYTFQSYADMPYEISEILAEFGIDFDICLLNLPKANIPPSIVDPLQIKLENNLRGLGDLNAAALKQALAAPIIFNVTLLTESQLRMEYGLNAGEYLTGRLSYLVEGPKVFPIVFAYTPNMDGFFTQLAVEMIALSHVRKDQKVFYGAVTTGNLWLFGSFDVDQRKVVKVPSILTVPRLLPEVLSVLVGCVTGV